MPLEYNHDEHSDAKAFFSRQQKIAYRLGMPPKHHTNSEQCQGRIMK